MRPEGSTGGGSTSTDFFDALYPDPVGHLAVFALPSARTTWVKAGDWKRAERAAQVFVAAKQNVYFGIALQDEAAAIVAASNGKPARSESTRGDDSTALLLPGLHADVDCVSPGKTAVPTIDEALEEMKEFPLPPSSIVFSGWGLQPQWFFREPLALVDDAARTEARRFLGGWQGFIRKRWNERGWTLDSTADIARVGRFPGTFNLKHGQRRPVRIDVLEPDRRYNLSDFEPYLVDVEPQAPRVPASEWEPLDPVTGAMVAVKELEILARLMKAGEERHSTAFDFFGQLRDARVSREVALDQIPIVLRIAKAQPRERDREMTRKELEDAVRDNYSTEPRQRSTRAERVVAGWGAEVDSSVADPRRLISPGDLFEEFLERKSTSIPTPWPRLSRALGGGWETRRNHVVTAQAGAGKTAFLVQAVAHAVRHGEFYGVLALRDGDQFSDGVRLAQLAGIDRFRLRDRDPDEVLRAREAMATYSERLMFYDVTAKDACIADMIDRGRTWAAGRGPLVAGTDSIHAMPYQDIAKEAAMNLYERVGLRLEALHCDLVKYDIAALTTAQASREAYRRKRTEENVEEIAAISGGHVAENTIDVLLNFGKTTEEGLSWLLIPKSRIGGQGERIPLRYDADRSRWIETDDTHQAEGEKPAQVRAKARVDAKAEELRKKKERVGAFLRKAKSGRTVKEIAEETGFRREWLAEVIAEFHAAGYVCQEEEPRTDCHGRDLQTKVWKWESPRSEA